MSKQITSPNSSFEPLDLLSFSRSGRTTPFHIFIDFIMPQFLDQLSKRKKHLTPSQKEDEGIQLKFMKILEELKCVENGCERLKEWGDRVNNEFKDLILNNLDDAIREGKEESRKSIETKILEEKLDQTLGVVLTLKTRLDSIKKLSSDNLESRSFKPSRFAKKLELNIENMMSESSILKEIREVYHGLKEEWKQSCLLCFSVFPQNTVIKKKALVHWWVGEGFLSDTSAEEKGNGLFEEFIARGIIERVPKKRRPSSELCKMHPLIRYAVIRLAETNNFTRFHPNGNPTADFSDKSNTRGGTSNFIRSLTNRNPIADFSEKKKNKRGFLVKTEEGYSSLRELTYGFRLKVEKVETLFNVSEPYVDLREDSLSEMKNLKVLQLGRYQESTKQVVEVDDTEFLNDLKKMKRLSYFSLRGITRVTALPDSICKLTKLIIVDLHACHYLESLPEGIGSLTNLTWLDISGCYLISHMPAGLSKLSKLQVLHGFLIGKPPKEKKRPGKTSGHDGENRNGCVPDVQKVCKLKDLAILESLKKLSINVDRRYKTEDVAELIDLSKFKNLVSLSVAWPEKEQSIEQGNSTNTTTATPNLTSPASLTKLELRFLPCSEMPDWVTILNLKNLKKLYVRGGKLSQVLHPVGCEKWNVSILRLELLSELQMDWRQLRALFPELRYVQKIKCPKLILFPCDENGEWARGREADTEHA
ncbi:disease resistance RPP13-like protein 4 [Corylus avellana]|uniref:disease resistance RPP13-like protein 4 n=1 Tax=Corylus avellana TaxID=13451 RepID=UPI00286AE8F8|nr:disease resistance RPP13-like protein 4 [Corylus avellana]